MRLATLKDRTSVIHIISQSFDDNNSANYIIKQDAKREIRLKKLIEYAFFYGLQFGKVFISDDQNACCILLYPTHKKTNYKTILWDLKLIFEVIGFKKIIKTMQRESRIKAMHPNTHFAHLWFIGVDPKHQKKGIGSRLLQEVLEFCDTTPVYLETSVESNVSWYQKFGFEMIKTIDLGYKLHLFKRK